MHRGFRSRAGSAVASHLIRNCCGPYNEFSRTHELAFREGFSGEVLETLTYHASEASALRALVILVKQLKADSLYVPDAYPLLHGLVSELRRIGLGSIPVYSVYSAQSDDVLNAVGPDPHGVYCSYPAIGEGDALRYFPRLGARILADVVRTCGEDDQCAIRLLRAKHGFDEYGVLRGAFGLKAIRNGRFEWIDS